MQREWKRGVRERIWGGTANTKADLKSHMEMLPKI